MGKLTNEQAIAEIKKIRFIWTGNNPDKDGYSALTAGIEALEKMEAYRKAIKENE